MRLLLEVELRPQVHLELVRERLELEELRRLGALLEQARRRADDVEVEVDVLDDPRPPDLHHDVAPIREHRRVDLRDRRCRQRLWLEPCERTLPEVLADDPLDLRERERRHLVDELAELLDVNVRKQVGPRREQLPELQVGGAELLERTAELDGALPSRRPVADEAHLAEDAKQAAAPCSARDLERAPRALEPCAHNRFFPSPLVRRNYEARRVRIARVSSAAETEPSNSALTRPSRPTRNVQGSLARPHCFIQRL